MPIYNGGGLTHGQALATISGLTAFGSSKVQIISFNWPQVDRAKIEVTNMNVQPTDPSSGAYGNKMFMPSAYIDGGELHLQILHDSTVKNPINYTNSGAGGPEYITISYGPGGAAAQQASSCYAWTKSYELEGELDGKALIANIVLVITDVLDGQYSSSGAVAQTYAS